MSAHSILSRKRRPSLSRGGSSYSTLSLILVLLIGVVCILQVFILNDSTSSLSLNSVSERLPGMAAATISKKGVPTVRQRRRWAYVFLLADCDPSTPQPAYRGTLYNILAATYVLKYHRHSHHHDDATTASSARASASTTALHSQADIVVLVQLSARSTAQRLDRAEEELLKKLNISIRYLPKPDRDAVGVPTTSMTFYKLVMAKFHVLSMVEYTKILFLDGDVLPLCNLDYLLELSSSSSSASSSDGASYADEHHHPHHRLGEIVLHAMYDDPVNAGLFVVTPQDKDWNETFQQWNEFRAIPDHQKPHVEYRLWNKGDNQKSAGWDFYCADSDQGFLLYWSLFLERSQSVSIIVGPTIEQYDVGGSGSSSTAEENHVSRRPTRVISSDFLSKYSCLPPVGGIVSTPKSGYNNDTTSSTATTARTTHQRQNNNHNPRAHTWVQNANAQAAQWPFYQDFYHMVGYSKAWESSPSTSNRKKNQQQQQQQQQHQVESTRDFWYFVLQQVVDRFDPNHTVIPHPLERLPEFVGKPKLRGDLLFTKPKPP